LEPSGLVQLGARLSTLAIHIADHAKALRQLLIRTAEGCIFVFRGANAEQDRRGGCYGHRRRDQHLNIQNSIARTIKTAAAAAKSYLSRTESIDQAKLQATGKVADTLEV
jgi:hypothetical protein